MDKDTSVNANSNLGLHSKGSQTAVDKDSNAQGTKYKQGSINQESSLLANAPILRSILKKAVRNVPGKDKNTSMSSVSTKVSGFKDKNACDIPTCDANELHSVGQQGDVDEVPLVGGIAAKVKNMDGTIFGSDGKVLKQSRMVHFADQVEVLPTEQHKDELAGNGMSSGVGKAGRGTPTQVAQAASNSQGLNSNSSQALVDNVGSGNINGEDSFAGAHAIFQPYRVSDHSPPIIHIPTTCKFKPRPFKFSNILVQNSRFKQQVQECWGSSVSGFHMFKVVSKLKALKKPFQRMLFREGNIHENVTKLRHELDVVQRALDLDPFNVDLREEEACYLNAFNEAILKEECS
ncbi:RNA-directed DNA polymerase, eukaryota, Reverse transcriptase zinc-binding domain protein [Artemisia annua]|uniref:RNA-directed DNA polymerase, eukaryota, Reverse transcriptase zinc-binding domain protein n=1 Tax=Artemisia annua TaxID=35608 RepID=A0A2U1KCY4_ARTAN|nr:RNA-directed DNA polymerase, eukaryota, Reverse transcriptase zinc-binding domain protein [Artemisia annua]